MLCYELYIDNLVIIKITVIQRKIKTTQTNISV